MKHLLLFISTLYCLNGFAITHPKVADPIVVTLNMPKEQAWQRLMDLVESNKLPIKFADKASGLMQTEPLGLGNHYVLKNTPDSGAWARCEMIKSTSKDSACIYPQIVHTELQMFIRETADGRTLLTLSLVNLTAMHLNGNQHFKLESTQRLENMLRAYFEAKIPMLTLNFDDPFARFGKLSSRIEKEVAFKKMDKQRKNGRDFAEFILILLGSAVIGFALLALVLRNS